MKSRYRVAQQLRAPYEPDMRLCVAYCMPRSFGGWTSDGPPVIQGGQTAAKRMAYDSTGQRALPKWQAILQRLCTPDAQRWAKLVADDQSLMRRHRVKIYFHELTEVLHKLRYAPRARFKQMATNTYAQIGVLGFGPNRIRWRKPNVADPRGGFAYRGVNGRDVYVLPDADGNIDTHFVRFFLTARMFKQWFGENVKPPPSVARELERPGGPKDDTYFEFVHCTYPRSDDEYDKYALDERRFPFCGDYLSVQDTEYVGKHEGYSRQPYLSPRSYLEPDDLYGYSPALRALPAMGGASAMKKSILRGAQKAVDPVILAHDDGVLSGRIGLTPSHVNWGGVDSQGRALIQTLPMGDVGVGIEMLQDERSDINDAFLVSLFEILAQDRERMTVPEVMERIAEKAALAAPTMGMLQSEQFGPQIEAEIAVLAENAPWMLPEMPPELVEANGEYQVEYTSPLAKGLYAEEDAGFMRIVAQCAEIAKGTGDLSVLDHFEFDLAIPDLADHAAVRPTWISTPERLEAKREERAEAIQAQQAVQAAPAMASVATAAMGQSRDNRTK
jgi:hypothetical protein